MLTNPLEFMLAGKAIFTVSSSRTGRRFTYKVERARANEGGGFRRRPWFVKVLTGPNNERHYKYLGCLWTARQESKRTVDYSHGHRSKVSVSAPSVVGFRQVLGWLQDGEGLPNGVALHHEGRCGRCGRRLTVPESIETGFGPECASVLGLKR